MNRTLREQVVMAGTGKSLRGCCDEIASKYFNAPFMGNCLHARCVYEVRGRNLPMPFKLRHQLIMFFMRRAMRKYPNTIGE
jgi:hypothetical protein